MCFGSVIYLGALYLISFHFIYSNHFSYALDFPVLVQSFLTPRPLGGCYLSGFPSSMGWNTLFWSLGDQVIESWNLKGGCAYGLNFIKICLLSTEEQFIISNQITIN
jgi:hypothetical protein